MSETPRGLSAFNRSIRVQLVVGTVLILTLVVLALTTLIARNATRLLEEQTSFQLDQLSTHSARAVSDFLDARTATVDLWGADTLLLSVVKDPGLAAVFMPGLSSYLSKYAVKEPWVGNVIITRGNELVFSLSPDMAGLAEFVERYEPTEASVHLEGAQGPNPPYLVISRQARDRGQPLDDVYVSLFLDLEIVQDRLLSNTVVADRGFAALIVPDGRSLLDTPLNAQLGTGTDNSFQVLNNEQYLIQTRLVQNTPLTVAWVASRAEIEAPVQRLALAIALLGGLAILVGLLGTIYFTGRVTAPIRRLSQDARREALQRFGRGTVGIDEANQLMADATTSSKLMGYGPDEVGELASVFELLGRTTDELTETNARLELRNRDLSEARTRLRENLDRLERELNSARKLQLSMVPAPDAGLSLGANVSVQALMEPAREVGGDFYDFFTVGDDTVCVLVGDVSDKGTPSALFMARTISLVRFSTNQIARFSGRSPRPSEVLSEVNAELCKSNATRMFVTLFMGVLDRRTGQMTYANAGHPSPIIHTSDDTLPISVDVPDLPLGVRPGLTYKDYELSMQTDDQLVLFTDGVTEAENNANRFYSLERLTKCIAAMPSGSDADLINRIRDDISDFADGAEQFDDITMLVLGWKPEERSIRP